MKRLLICMDGTSNTYEAEYTTNVVKTHKSIAPFDADGSPQSAFYVEGVGARFGSFILGGAFGKGLFKRVLKGYRHFAQNKAGNPALELYLCGFSRGAYTARSLAGLIGRIGVMEPCSEDQLEQATRWYKRRKALAQQGETDLKSRFFHWRAKASPNWCADVQDRDWRRRNGYPDAPLVEIAYVGIWDTVKTLGMIEGRYKWHDHDLSDHVRSARHAVAIDERRSKFDYTPWDNIDRLNAACGHDGTDPHTAPYQQMWFPGDHGSVGGGGPVTGLSDVALDWIRAGAEAAGLAFRGGHGLEVFEVRPDPLAPLRNSEGRKLSLASRVGNAAIQLFGQRDREGLSRSVDLSRPARLRYFAPSTLLPEGQAYRPGSMKVLFKILDGNGSPFGDADFALLEKNSARFAQDELPVFINLLTRRYRVHVVRKGDTLSSVSQRYLGEPNRYMELFSVNSAVLDDPDKLYTDMRLFVPLDPAPS